MTIRKDVRPVLASMVEVQFRVIYHFSKGARGIFSCENPT